jgi:hypothetical protein
VPHAEEIMPMMHNMRPNPMPTLLYCAQQEFLRHLARLAGVNGATVWTVGKNCYQLSMLIQGKTQEWFLATRREPRGPRTFARLGAAVRLGQCLFKVVSMTVICRS